MRLRDCLHSKEIVLWVFKDKRRDGPARCPAAEATERLGLTMNPFRIAMPITRYSQLWKCLFQNPCIAVLPPN